MECEEVPECDDNIFPTSLKAQSRFLVYPAAPVGLLLVALCRFRPREALNLASLVVGRKSDVGAMVDLGGVRMILAERLVRVENEDTRRWRSVAPGVGRVHKVVLV